MLEREKVIKGLEYCIFQGQSEDADCRVCPYYKNSVCWIEVLQDALGLLKQDGCENCAMAIEDRQMVIRCKDCRWWVPGYITDKDDFIPPKCGKYQQMVGHSADDFCNFAEWNKSECR